MKEEALTKNITRNIISEVLRECKNHQITASSEFIAYYINLLRLDPNTGLTQDFLTNREQLQDFIKRIITSLLDQKHTPQIRTLRLQHVIETYVENVDSTIEEFRVNLSMQLYPCLLNITEQKTGNIVLFKKISHYAVLASGLGNPNEKPVYKETVQVLRSILNDEEIRVFPSLQNCIKQEIVQCLTDIITGIRLYNKQCKKGGEGMPDLPHLLNGALKAIHSKLTQSRDHTISKAKLLRKCAAKNMNITKKPSGEWVLQLHFQNEVEIEKWEDYKNTVTLQEQLAKIIQILLDSLQDLNSHKDNLEEEFQESIFKLKTIVIPHLHQSVTEVFPHFLQLASIYKSLQDDALKLKGLQNIFMTVEQLVVLKHECNRFDDKEEATLPWLQINEKSHQTIANPDVVYHTNKARFLMNNLEFGGYCCWVLTNTNGLLVPALSDAGVVEYKSRFYGFCSILAANSFCLNPLDYIMNTISLARRNVCLIKLLNLEKMLGETFHIKNLVEEKNEPKIQVTDAMIQTETHCNNGYMDYNYFWNTWDHKKRILKQVELNTSVTIGCQTDKTHLQQSTKTQTYKKADEHTQTKVANYMNTKKPKIFIGGLRGERKNICPFVMDLSEPLEYTQPIIKK